jgi:hypothetical protein
VIGGHAGRRAFSRVLKLFGAATTGLALILGTAAPASAADDTFTLRGVVVSPSGAPAGGVGVRLEDASGTENATTTAADGSYRFAGLRAGSYSLSAIAAEGSGYQTAWKGVGPSAGDRDEPTFTLTDDMVADLQFRPGGMLSGTVRLDGRPRAGVLVCPEYPADPTRCVRSSADGRYTITELPTWTEDADLSGSGSGAMYPPTAFARPGDPFLTTVDWGSAYHGRYLPTFGIPDDTKVFEQDIDLAPIIYVSGTVASTAGVPVKNAAVCSSSGRLKRCTTTGAAGSFRVRVDFLAWDAVAVLSVRAGGYRPSGEIEVSQTEVGEPVHVTLTPLPKVRSHRPAISGYRYSGHLLRAVTGPWTKATKFSYRWYRNGKRITHATKSSYRLKRADISKRIAVLVTGKKAGYVSVSRTSRPTVRVGVQESFRR